MASSNFLLFTGENAYALGAELKRWKNAFAEKHGQENMLSLSAKDCSVSDLLDALSVMPFVAEKRLVILEGIPKIEKDDMVRILAEMHPQTVFVIVEAKPDKRLGVVKEIERSAEIKSFGKPSHVELVSWVKQSLASHGSTIAPDALQALFSIVGDDQWTLRTELEKLSSGSDEEITVGDVERLCVPSGSQVIWKFTELLGSKKPKEALAFCSASVSRGEDPYGFWVILLAMIKNLTSVFAAVEAGTNDERSIASSTGLHFLAVRGLLPLARSMDQARIRSLVDWAADADIQLKTGGYRYSAERPDEVIALTERAILMTVPHP